MVRRSVSVLLRLLALAAMIVVVAGQLSFALALHEDGDMPIPAAVGLVLAANAIAYTAILVGGRRRVPPA